MDIFDLVRYKCGNFYLYGMMKKFDMKENFFDEQITFKILILYVIKRE